MPIGLMFCKHAKYDEYGEFIGIRDDAPKSVKDAYEKEVKRRKELKKERGYVLR